MQRILNSLLGLSLIFLVVFSTGCGDDGTGGGGGTNVLPPTIFLASGDDLVSFDSSVPFGDGSFFVRVDINDGDNPLNSLTITEDGTTIPPANLEYDEGLTTSQNPFLIIGADQSGTTYDIEIFPTDLSANETRTYAFVVADTEGERAETTVAVTFAAAPPTISLTGNFSLESGDDVSLSSPNFQIATNTEEGDANISSIAVYENGVLLSADSVAFVDGVGTLTPFITNPELNGGQVFFGDHLIQVNPTNPIEGLSTYTFEVTDVNGAIASATFDINFVTPMVDVLMGVLLNAGGPMGTGGLDLDDGTGSGSNDDIAEIKDNGIDLSLPNGQNWRQTISATNNATLRSINVADLPDGFDFDAVTSYQTVIDAYNVGTTITDSDFIAGGELFGIERDGSFYLIRIADVTVTANDNDDSYTIDIINEAN